MSADWNTADAGSVAPGNRPPGSGKAGTPCARMHLANDKLKPLLADRCPVPPVGPCPLSTLTGPLPWLGPPLALGPPVLGPPVLGPGVLVPGVLGPGALRPGALGPGALVQAARLRASPALKASPALRASAGAIFRVMSPVLRSRLLRERDAVTVLQQAIGDRGAMRVLLVEDHAKLAMTLAAGLRRAGMAVDVAFDGHDALEHLAVTGYDVVVLDRDIPGVHGDEVCRQVVTGGPSSRVLMLTAAGTVEDRVAGLGLGADDYLPKPCDFAELVARVRALARRPGTAVPPVLTMAGVTLDPSRRVAARDGRPLQLNPKEFAMLELLLSAQGAVVSAEEILERVWDEMADPFSQAVRTTMSRLRAKLGDPPVIQTVAKAGYQITE